MKWQDRPDADGWWWIRYLTSTKYHDAEIAKVNVEKNIFCVTLVNRWFNLSKNAQGCEWSGPIEPPEIEE